MTVTAFFSDGTSTSVLVDPWDVDASVKIFIEMGALFVGTKQE